MTPWIDDLDNPKSKSLAAMHFGNRWILNNQCYTCHADYGFLGPIRTKLESMGHVARYYGSWKCRSKSHSTSHSRTANCLQCHGPAASFQNNPAHVAVMKPILANQLSCVTCHQPIHTPVG